MSDKRGSGAATAARTKVVTERTYRARLDDLWKLWTTKEGFESWWGPEGFRAEVHALDARPGGRLHYFTSQLGKLDRRFGGPEGQGRG